MGMDICLNASPKLLATSIQINAQARAPDKLFPLKKGAILSCFQVLLTSITSHSFPLKQKSAHKMWSAWSFVFFSLRLWEVKGGFVGKGWGGWRGVFSNELYRTGAATLKWEETDLPPNMNTRKMQMYPTVNLLFWICSETKGSGKQREWKWTAPLRSLPPKKKERKKKRSEGEGEDGRENDGGEGGEGGDEKRGREGERGRGKILGPVSSIFFFFLSNGILCSWMCRCHGNCNLVTSLFLPNPTLKLWLLHPFAWLPW